MRLFFLFTLFTQFTLFGADSIGKITAAEGVVRALSGKIERTLSQGADIFVKETISVASGGKAQIQFTDGGLINLISDTEYRVNTYKFKKIFQRDQSSSELLKGGFRALSGTIAHKNPAKFEVKTPSATIGLRGTIIEVNLGASGQTFVGVSNGQAVVANAAGSWKIGGGAKTDFVRVPSKTVAAVLLLERPYELEISRFAPPAGGISIDEAQQQRQALLPSSGGRRSKSASSPGSDESEVDPSDQEAPGGGEDIDFGGSGGGASIQGGC